MPVLIPISTNGADPGRPDAELWYAAGWLCAREADALLPALRDAVQWETHRLRLFGREVDSPRLSCWIGDEGAAYAYSGARFEPKPWPSALVPVRQRLEQELQAGFNSVLANRYRTGADSMGWHSDDEAALGPQPVIASLSLGATRRFLVKPRQGAGERLALDLVHGSLLVMRGATQQHYRHALPRTGRPVGERINLTFRRIIG